MNEKYGKEWLLWDESSDKKPISNFIPEVIAIIITHTDVDGESNNHIKLRLRFKNGKPSKEFTKPISDIEGIQWSTIDRRCQLHPSIPKAKAHRYLAEAVRSQLTDAQEEEQYIITRLGTTVVAGEPIFCTGDGLIRPSPDNKDSIHVLASGMSHSFDVDTDLAEHEVAADMLGLVSLCPDAGRVILSLNLLYIMRPAYEVAWKSPGCCVFLHGKTGLKKTTYSAFMTQRYDRKRGIKSPTRLNATEAAIVALLEEMRDDVLLLDDLFPATTITVRSHQEEMFFKILRIITDGSRPARMVGKSIMQQQPTCGVLVTGEYLVGTGSDAARFLPVEMTPVDGQRLKCFQDRPLIVSTFYCNFISWFVNNYFEIIEWFREWHVEYLHLDLGVHDRLRETHYFLGTAYLILLQYCHEIEVLSSGAVSAMFNSFQQLLTQLVQEQQFRVGQGALSEIETMDFLSAIRRLYVDGSLHLADNKETIDESHDGLIYDDDLCLRRGKFKRFFPQINIITIIKNLESQNALKARSCQVHGTGGIRFFSIPMCLIKGKETYQ